MSQCGRGFAGQRELGQRVERRPGRAGGPQQLDQQRRHAATGPLDRRRVLAVQRIAEQVGACRIEPRLGDERCHQGRRVEIDRESALQPEPVERVGRQQDDLGIAGSAGPDADELEADLAKLPLGPQLAAAHAEDLAGVAQAKRPGASREPGGRDARDLRREIAAQGHHAVRGRVHQAEGLVGEPGAGAAQHAVLEFDEGRLDPSSLRAKAPASSVRRARPGPASGGRGAQAVGAGRSSGFHQGGDTHSPGAGAVNGRGRA